MSENRRCGWRRCCTTKQSACRPAYRGARRFDNEVVRALNIDWRALVFLKNLVHATNSSVQVPGDDCGRLDDLQKVYR